MSRRYLLASVLASTSILIMPWAVVAQNQPQAAPKATIPAATRLTAKKYVGPVHGDGERIFAQNCSRCHTAPDGFSPSISGTVVRHMRVRASLSQHDEQELLRFFNP
jgi:cytochrome c5